MNDEPTTVPAAPAGRTASREVRRQQLIEATIVVLAAKGYAALTLGDVSRVAGLSVGIVDFHFGGKQELLAETLRTLAVEYRGNWQRAMADAGPDTAARLAAMQLSDFDPRNYSVERLAAWIAFWGESQGRPVYDAICAEFDTHRLATTTELCAALISEGGYDRDAGLAARVLEALGDGLWYGMVSAAARGSREAEAERATAAVMSALSAYFPKHFRPRPV